MMTGNLKVSFWILLLSLLAAIPAPGQNYYWPMKIKPRLSSHFGDYRAGHWHAGVDITTNARTGYRVYAVSDGYVFRVRTGYWGYGKALYLKLSDGRYAVYGHLQGFTKKLDEYIRHKQMKDGKYYQDLYFSPGEFPVKRGEFIALSGQTGGGAPHLHLEIRDINNLPVDPLNGIFELPDSQPPAIDFLVIKRFKDYGLANYHETEFLPIAGRPPAYTVDDTIDVYNIVNFAAAAYDPNGGFNYGVSRAELLLDDTPIFGFAVDKLNYESGPQIDYVRDNELSSLVEKRFGVAADNDINVFYRLYVQPDDRQLFYQDFSYPAGLIYADSLGPGIHSLAINFSDNHDNTCRLQMYLKAAALNSPVIDSMYQTANDLTIALDNSPPGLEPQVQYRRGVYESYNPVSIVRNGSPESLTLPDMSSDGNYRIRLKSPDSEISPWIEFAPEMESESVVPFADYLDVIVKKDMPIRVNELHLGNFENVPLLDNYFRALIPVPVTSGYFKLNLNDTSGGQGFYVFNSTGRAYSPDSTISLYITSQNLYGNAIIEITEPMTEKSGAVTFNIRPEGLLLKQPVVINVDPVRTGFDSTYLSLYYYSQSKDKWFYIGDDSLHKLDGRTGGGGKFGFLEDKKPPSITRVRPANNTSTTDRTPLLSCYVNDDLSGLSRENQLEMTIDNIWVPAEYDIDTRSLTYQVRGSLKSGVHTLRVTATDNQGNRNRAVAKFTIK